VLENAPVTTRLMAVDDAIASGARALFGEKYGDEVRVVSMGEGTGNTMGWSVELCGGTHVRRIEALTGRAARKAAHRQIRLLETAAAELKAPADEVPARVTALLDERKKLERELSDARKKLAMGGGASADGQQSNIVDVNGIKYFRLHVSGLANNELKALADEGKLKVKSGVVAVANTAPDGKAGIVVGVTKDLTDRFNAVDLVRKGAEALGGKGGGGRPDMAQAGGPDGSKADAALKAIEAALGA
jgi:alanyl-tRNA synthetase